MHAKRFPSLLLLICAVTVAARAEDQPIESPENLRFMRNTEAVYVFPVTNPSKPRRDDKHLRLLDSKARAQLLQVLADPRNWNTGFFTILQSDNQPTNIGLLFRHQGKELVLFFQWMTIQGQFDDKTMIGMLEENGRKEIEQWKERYAQQELATK